MTIRGLWTHAGVLYSVQDAKLYSHDSAGLKTERGTLNSNGGVVDFESSLTQMVVNDGIYLYVYEPTLKTFAVAAGYPGGDRIGFLDQRIVFLYRNTQQFGWTALANAKSIGALSFASAESSPDTLISLVVSNREIYLLGQDGTEIWDSSGNADQPYTRSSAAIDYGCAAPHSAQRTSNAVIWLGRNALGQAMVLSAQGHQARRISTRAQEERFDGISLSSARAFTFSDGGQSFYCLNIPALDTTMVWDETFQQWHERGEWVNGAWQKWRPTCHAFAYGKHFFGAGDKLFTSDPKVHTYGGDVLRRQRIAPVIASPTHKRVVFPMLEVICDKGTGATVMLRWSDDNGSNWSKQHYTTVGAQGQFKARAKFYRLGSSYDRVFDLVMTDDAPFNPVQLVVELK